MTPLQKEKIDAMTYQQLLQGWRFAPAGDKRFQGEHGRYWGERMAQLRAQPGGDAENTRASKAIGW